MLVTSRPIPPQAKTGIPTYVKSEVSAVVDAITVDRIIKKFKMINFSSNYN